MTERQQTIEEALFRVTERIAAMAAPFAEQIGPNATAIAMQSVVIQLLLTKAIAKLRRCSLHLFLPGLACGMGRDVGAARAVSACESLIGDVRARQQSPPPGRPADGRCRVRLFRGSVGLRSYLLAVKCSLNCLRSGKQLLRRELGDHVSLLRFHQIHKSRERRAGRLNVWDRVIGLRQHHLIGQALARAYALNFCSQARQLQGDG